MLNVSHVLASNETFPLKKINVNYWNSRSVMGSAVFFWLRLCSYNMLRREIDDLWAMVTSWSQLILWSSVLKAWPDRLLYNGEVEQKKHQLGGSLVHPNTHWRSTSMRKPVARRGTCKETFSSRKAFSLRKAD